MGQVTFRRTSFNISQPDLRYLLIVVSAVNCMQKVDGWLDGVKEFSNNTTMFKFDLPAAILDSFNKFIKDTEVKLTVSESL